MFNTVKKIQSHFSDNKSMGMDGCLAGWKCRERAIAMAPPELSHLWSGPSKLHLSPPPLPSHWEWRRPLPRSILPSFLTHSKSRGDSIQSRFDLSEGQQQGSHCDQRPWYFAGLERKTPKHQKRQISALQKVKHPSKQHLRCLHSEDVAAPAGGR